MPATWSRRACVDSHARKYLVRTKAVRERKRRKSALGATARGGAQKGAARLDVGPKVSFRLTVGHAPARIEADYLWRVAGNAAPGNGGLITLSTGF